MKTQKNNIKLSNRLLKCAQAVTPGSKIADIGTDHAYIPIYLALNNIIFSAIAADLREGPLKNAQQNIAKYDLENIIQTRLSDGLDNIYENEVDEIIIAGMGGNIIINILDKIKWKNKFSKTFILQPMKYEQRLRVYLAKFGYEIKSEQAITCTGKVYTVMKVIFTDKPYFITPEEEYIGKLNESLDQNAKAYIKKQIKDLENRRKGAQANKLYEKDKYFKSIIKNLKHIIE